MGGLERILPRTEVQLSNAVYSADHQWLYFTGRPPSGIANLYKVAAGGGEPTTLVRGLPIAENTPTELVVIGVIGPELAGN